jgi:hypothetical protein
MLRVMILRTIDCRATHKARRSSASLALTVALSQQKVGLKHSDLFARVLQSNSNLQRNHTQHNRNKDVPQPGTLAVFGSVRAAAIHAFQATGAHRTLRFAVE